MDEGRSIVALLELSLYESVMLKVVAETAQYVVVDKPALLDSQNSRGDRPSVVDWLTQRFGFSGLVHRLDFGTSGLMVCAKTAAAAKSLTAALARGDIKRVYWAVVLGKMPQDSGALRTPIEEQPAVSHFRVLERFANATLVEVELETGRKHQIRRHFADAGHPLLGDHLYGKRGAQRLFDRPALHARKLVVEGCEFESEVPADLDRLLVRLRATRT